MQESIAKLVSEISAKEPHLNLLVNNAGISGPTREVEKAKQSAEALKEELWKDTFDDWQNVDCISFHSNSFTHRQIRFIQPTLLGTTF